MKHKIVFITGGVLSSLGKGIISSSIARLLSDQGVNINMMKLDPYLNVDPGTMSPIEHGEVYVTADGGETDLDIGHYERLLSKNLSKKSSVSSGQIYQEIIKNEREGKYLGKTVQVIPHVTDQIKKVILNNAKDYDLLFVELGGTVGDIESLPFLEAIRQLQTSEDVFIIHGAYVPYLKSSKELKTKPVQHSISELQSLGIRPNMIITRNEIPLTDGARSKIASLCGVKYTNIIESVDVDSVYRIPLLLKEQNADEIVAQYFDLSLKQTNHEELKEVVNKLDNLTEEINVAIVGKYTQLDDAYLSVIEAIKHASIAHNCKANITLVAAQEPEQMELDKYDGIIVAGGFGESGIAGKMAAITYARENNVPFLGICLGMQLACIEFAKNVAGISDAAHRELQSDGTPIIDIMEDQDLNQLGGTLRLGDFECQLKPQTLAHQLYQQDNVNERHRHRYEFNNDYREILEQNGLVFSGINPQRNLAEIVEYPQNDFFIASQFHPEFNSKLTAPQPLFSGLIKSIQAKKHNKK